MSLLNAFKPKAAPVRQPGRHSAEWAAMRRDLAAAQSLSSTLKAAQRTAVERHETEMHQQAADFQVEREGLRESLRLAAEANRELRRERDEARDRHDEVLKHLRAAEAEVRRQRTILDASTGEPGSVPTVAPLDDPESCFSQPDPAPAGDEPRTVADTPVAPASYEIANVNAETQAVDVADLRAGAEATQQLDVTALRNATGLGATAVLPVVTAPPLPDCKPPMPGEVTVVDAVLPLWQQSVPVSLGTGQRARDSVAAALLP